MSVSMRNSLWVLEDVGHFFKQNSILALDLSEAFYTTKESKQLNGNQTSRKLRMIW